MIGHALAYAVKLHVPVLPLHTVRDGACSCGDANCASPGKHPRTRHGLHDASTDPAVVRRMWTRWPDANIGGVCGTPGGIIVADADTLEAEIQLAQRLSEGDPAQSAAMLLEPLVAGGGLVVRTRRGLHRWFSAPPDRTVPSGKLGHGLDLRAARTYVAMPPSRYAGGEYAFLGGQLDPLPLALIADLKRTRPSMAAGVTPMRSALRVDDYGGPTTAYGQGVIERRCADICSAPRGERNFALLRAATTCAGYAATGEIDLAEAEEALRAVALDRGPEERPPLREVEQTIDSGFRRGIARPLHRPPSRLERLLAANSLAEQEHIVEETTRDA